MSQDLERWVMNQQKTSKKRSGRWKADGRVITGLIIGKMGVSQDKQRECFTVTHLRTGLKVSGHIKFSKKSQAVKFACSVQRLLTWKSDQPEDYRPFEGLVLNLASFCSGKSLCDGALEWVKKSAGLI